MFTCSQTNLLTQKLMIVKCWMKTALDQMDGIRKPSVVGPKILKTGFHIAVEVTILNVLHIPVINQCMVAIKLGGL